MSIALSVRWNGDLYLLTGWSSVAALSTLPAGLYILLEKFLLHRNTAVVGARLVALDSCLVVSIVPNYVKYLGIPASRLRSDSDFQVQPVFQVCFPEI